MANLTLDGVKKLCDEGYSYREIGERLGCSGQAVGNFCRKNGIKKKDNRGKTKKAKNIVKATYDKADCTVCNKEIVFTSCMTRTDYQWKVHKNGSYRYQCCYTHMREEQRKLEGKRKYKGQYAID